jgi:uncharacterized RDD family membrane protein YckC
MTNIDTTYTANVPLAAKGIRYLAILIDYLMYFLFYWLIASNYGTITTTNNSISTEVNGFPAILCFVFWFIIPLSEGVFSQSLGKFVCGIKVVDASYQKVKITQCIVRHLFDLVDFFPFIGIVGLSVSSSNKLKQRVGDLVAKTIVVTK